MKKKKVSDRLSQEWTNKAQSERTGSTCTTATVGARVEIQPVANTVREVWSEREMIPPLNNLLAVERKYVSLGDRCMPCLFSDGVVQKRCGHRTEASSVQKRGGQLHGIHGTERTINPSDGKNGNDGRAPSRGGKSPFRNQMKCDGPIASLL